MATSASKAAPKPGAKPGPAPNASADSAEAATGKLSQRNLIIIAAAVLLLAIGGGAWFFLGYAQHGEKGANEQVKHAPPPVFLHLETFTVNLQSEETQQFLQTNMTLQVSGNSQVDFIKENMPQVRNRILLLLSSKKAAEILSPDGKKKLAAEIVAQVRQPFTPQGPKPEVSDVFFTSFVVQ